MISVEKPTQADTDLVEQMRRLYRGLEMSGRIMRDVERTGGWRGADRTAAAFERYAATAQSIHALLKASAAAREATPEPRLAADQAARTTTTEGGLRAALIGLGDEEESAATFGRFGWLTALVTDLKGNPAAISAWTADDPSSAYECLAEVEALIRDVKDILTASPATLDICPQCDGSGVGVADTVCTLCNGSGGIPFSRLAADQAARAATTEAVDGVVPPREITYNPVFNRTYPVADPSRGHVYRLATPPATPAGGGDGDLGDPDLGPYAKVVENGDLSSVAWMAGELLYLKQRGADGDRLIVMERESGAEMARDILAALSPSPDDAPAREAGE